VVEQEEEKGEDSSSGGGGGSPAGNRKGWLGLEGHRGAREPQCQPV